MKKLLLYTVLFFSAVFGYAQNLVPNPSFEVYDTCPDFTSQIRHTITWFDANTGTSDYYNTCSISPPNTVGIPSNYFGYRYAHGGNAYAGFMVSDDINYVNYREYIETKLTDSLVAGTKYFISFYVSLSDSSNWATDDIGVYFSNDSLFYNDFRNIPLIPQIENTQGNILNDKVNWTQIKGSYTAVGGEKYITIGNFKDTISTTYVSVPNGGDINFYNFPYYYIDDFCLSTDSLLCSLSSFINESNKSDKVLIYPNPADNNIRIITPFVKGQQDVFIMFYYTGAEAFRCAVPLDGNIDLSELPVGLYYCQIQHKSKKYSSKILIKR